MSSKLAIQLGRFVAAFLVFLLLSEVWDVVIDGAEIDFEQREVVTALLVAALICFWRARQDRRRNRMHTL